MDNRINQILEVNNKKYFILKQAYYKKNNYYVVVLLDNQVFNTFELFEEFRENNKMYLKIVKNIKLKKLILNYLQLTNKYKN